MALPTGPGALRRLSTVAVVVAIHLGLLVVLTSTGAIPPLLPVILPARLIIAPHPPPPPPTLVKLTLTAPQTLAVPLPDIRPAAPPPVQHAPRAVSHSAPAAPPASHFGAATGSGLGLDVATSAGGGAGTRGTLAGFEATVRARVLANKHQPTLAWDRRNTCVINYRVSVNPRGGLAGFSIDECAVEAINDAARAAIRAAAPFPAPPDLGAASAEVHGSLIFHP